MCLSVRYKMCPGARAHQVSHRGDHGPLSMPTFCTLWSSCFKKAIAGREQTYSISAEEQLIVQDVTANIYLVLSRGNLAR